MPLLSTRLLFTNPGTARGSVLELHMVSTPCLLDSHGAFNTKPDDRMDARVGAVGFEDFGTSPVKVFGPLGQGGLRLECGQKKRSLGST